MDTAGPAERGAGRGTQVSEPRPVLFLVNQRWCIDAGTAGEVAPVEILAFNPYKEDELTSQVILAFNTTNIRLDRVTKRLFRFASVCTQNHGWHLGFQREKESFRILYRNMCVRV